MSSVKSILISNRNVRLSAGVPTRTYVPVSCYPLLILTLSTSAVDRFRKIFGILNIEPFACGIIFTWSRLMFHFNLGVKQSRCMKSHSDRNQLNEPCHHRAPRAIFLPPNTNGTHFEIICIKKNTSDEIQGKFKFKKCYCSCRNFKFNLVTSELYSVMVPKLFDTTDHLDNFR